MRMNFPKVMAAGLVGTLAMTGVGLWGAPMMGMAPMNPAEMLAGQMGGNIMLGWAGHLMIGVVLAMIYVLVARPRLPGSPPVRGAIFSVLPWLVAQLAMMPMMGMPVFSGSMKIAMGSLIGHFVFGAVVGGMLGEDQHTQT